MDKKIQKVLDIWHKHFSDEEYQYSEYEPSDIEYFVGCMLYNHFAFSKALDTMKTMDLSYDFLSSCGDEYDDIKAVIESINFDDELEALRFLQDYIDSSRQKYTSSELYLLNRLKMHIDNLEKRYMGEVDAQSVDFVKMNQTRSNPFFK